MAVISSLSWTSCDESYQSYTVVCYPSWHVLHCGMLSIWHVLHCGMLSILTCPTLWYVIHPDMSYTVVCYPSWHVLHCGMLSIVTCPTLWYVINPDKSYTVVCYPYLNVLNSSFQTSTTMGYIGIQDRTSTAVVMTIMQWPFSDSKYYCDGLLWPFDEYMLKQYF